MWPWEHVAFGYLCYSLLVHLGERRAPTNREALVVGVASLLSDLVDKPLSWSLKLFPVGYSIAHSVFVAPVLVALVAAVAHWRGRLRSAAAFAVSYLSHLVGDIVHPAILGEGLKPRVVLWPIAEFQPYESDYGLFERATVYFVEYARLFAAGETSLVVLFELGLVVSVCLLWLYDGTPGFPTPHRLSAGRRE